MAEGGGPDLISCDFPLSREHFWPSVSRPTKAAAEGTAMRGSGKVPSGLQLNLGRQISAPSLQSPSPKAQLTALSIPAAAARDGEHQGSELQIRREKFAFFEKHCSEVAERIFLSGDAVARSETLLKESGITHVLNAVGFLSSEYFRDNRSYCTFWLQDTPTEDLTCILYSAFDFMEESLAAGGRLLVHCSQGVSRSASIVIAYLMWRDGKEYEETFRRVKATRGIANPNMGFTCQLLQWAKRRRGPLTAPRLYALTPHNAHDPRRLVARLAQGPSADAFDSRGSFVLQTTETVYIWVGPSAPPEFETAAALFATQLSRYEAAPPDPIRVTPGEEPSAFLDALSVCGEHRRPDGVGWLGAREAHCAAFDDPFAMFTSGRRSDIALRGGEGAAELERAAGAGKMDWDSKCALCTHQVSHSSRIRLRNAREERAQDRRCLHCARVLSPAQLHSPLRQTAPPGGEGPSGQEENQQLLSATMPPPSLDESVDLFRSLPAGFRGFPVLRALPEGSETTASPLSTFRSGPSTSRAARGGDEASGSGKSKEARAGDGGGKGNDRAALLQYPGFKALSMFDSEDLLSESVFLLVDSGSRKILVWLGAEFMEDEGSDGEGGGADVAKRIADEACAAGAVGDLEGWAVRPELEGSESSEFWDIFEG